MYSGDEFYGDEITSPSDQDVQPVLTDEEMDALDAEARCETCGFLEGGTFCQASCGGGVSPADQAREAAEYDYDAQFDSVRERYAGETGRLDGDEEDFKAKNAVEARKCLDCGEEEASAPWEGTHKYGPVAHGPFRAEKEITMNEGTVRRFATEEEIEAEAKKYRKVEELPTSYDPGLPLSPERVRLIQDTIKQLTRALAALDIARDICVAGIPADTASSAAYEIVGAMRKLTDRRNYELSLLDDKARQYALLGSGVGAPPMR